MVTQRALLGAGAVVVVGIVAATLTLGWLGSGGGSAVNTTSLTSASSSGTPPPPPRGALVLAREAGTRAVAIAIARGARPRLTATVLGQSGGGESGLPVSFRLGPGNLPSLRARSCGAGCYTALAPAGVSLRRVEVVLPGGPVSFRFPAAPRAAGGIVERATRVFHDLRSLVFVESLRSGPTGGIVTTWRFAAPDRVTYRIRGGASAVVIGRRRWDQERPGGPWARSQQIPALQVPQPTWGDHVVDAHVLGTGRVAGRPVWIASFADPGIPAWFTAWIDRRTYRTLELRMTAAAHFMHHRYLEFDRPLAIRPPR
jgi:hypothetical protein